MSAAAPQAINETKLHEFMMKAVGEMGAAMNTALILIGDKLGLYKAMAGAGPMTSAELAAKTEHDRTLRPRMAFRAGRRRIRHIRRRRPHSSHCLPSKRWRWLMKTAPCFCPAFFRPWKPRSRAFRKSPPHSRPAKELAGTSTTPASLSGTERFFRPNYRATFDQ